VTRLWTYSKAKGGSNGANGNGQPPPPSWPPDGGTEMVALPMGVEPERYASRPARSLAPMAIRIGLWAAVALGCVGGIVGLLRPSGGEPETVVAPSDDELGVPGPVVRMAEVVAEEWLTATEDDEERLASLFVEPPSLEGVATGELRVGRVAAIAGRPLQEGYWAVTVEVEVTESIPVAEETEDPAAGEGDQDPAAGEDGAAAAVPAAEEDRTTVWYLDVPIVGQVDGGLAALTTPAVLPGRPEVSTGWRPSLGDPQPPADGDPTASKVDGFLGALLTGAGDPERYVAPGVTARPADPAPFADIEVTALAVDQLAEGEYRVLAEVSALTIGGARQRFSYELVVVERVDRLEITQFSGAPTMVAGSADPSESEDQSSNTTS
jgi:hypothetical protein